MAQLSNRAMFETFIRELTEAFPYAMKYVAPSVISVRNCIDEIARLRQEGKEVTDETRREILTRNLVFNPKNRSCMKAMEDFYCAYWFVRQYKQDPRPFDSILISNPYRYVRFHRANRLPQDEVTQAKRREMLNFVADALRQGLKVEDLQNVDESIEYLWERAGTQENAVNSSDDDFMLTEGKGKMKSPFSQARKGKGLLDRYVNMNRSTDPVTEDEKGYEVSPEGFYAISNAVLHKMFDEFNIVPTERDESYVDAVANRRLRSRVTGERPPYSEAQIVLMLLQAIPAIFFVRGNRNYIYSDRLQVAEEALQREHRLQNASPAQTRAPPPSPSGEGIKKKKSLPLSEQQLIKHAREMALKHNIAGRGLFSKIKEHAKKAVGWLKEKALPIAKDVGLSGFQALSNAMRAEARKKGIPARDLQKGELHIGLSNWSGPHTVVEGNENVPPIGVIDAVSKKHDLDYYAAGKIKDPVERAKAVHKADEEAIRGYLQHPNAQYQKEALAAIGGKWVLEQALSALRGVASTIYG